MDVNLTSYLMLDGNAKEAISFYSDVFEAKVESMELYKDWPQEFEENIPEGYEDKVIHAHLTLGSSELLLADIFPGQPYTPGSVITLMLDVKKVSDAEILFEKLSSNGDIIIPLSETSFSPAYAQVKDKFGIEWQIVTDFPEMN
ncbi:VOC family protein [Alkalibacterium sp. f15]|uniref:VOC family protein n=1 Tax=Alkalibacterium sp. f15 TaxID=3414029 RepID=UPI003BF896AC